MGQKQSLFPVQIELQQKAYQPGDNIIGKVSANIPDNIQNAHIQIAVLGMLTTYYKIEKHSDQQKAQVFKDSKDLHIGEFPSKQFVKNFEFPLPPKLPQTTSFVHSQSPWEKCNAQIRYFVCVLVEANGIFDVSGGVEFYMAPSSSEVPIEAQQDAEFFKHGCCGRPGNIIMSPLSSNFQVSISPDVAYVDQEVEVTLKSSIANKKVQVTLHRDTQVGMRNGFNIFMYQYKFVDVAQQVCELQEANVEKKIKIKVPDSDSITSFDHELFKARYSIQVKDALSKQHIAIIPIHIVAVKGDRLDNLGNTDWMDALNNIQTGANIGMSILGIILG